VRIIFDHGVPVPLRGFLPEREVLTAYEMGWSGLENGELLRLAEDDFEVLVTTDQSLRYQQNLTGRRLAILVLPTTSWPTIRRHVTQVANAIAALRPGDYREIAFES